MRIVPGIESKMTAQKFKLQNNARKATPNKDENL